MTGAFRIGQGERIRFTFDGKPLEGIRGDTLASALLANGIHLTGRSFKYHRPRGILTAGAEEPNALVTIDRGLGRVTPNLRATTIELHEGLTARSQNAWPSIRFDLGAIAGLASPLLSAGFYYKTFMWPPAFWKRLYEPAIRAAAGLGRAPKDPDPDRYLHRYAHCDLLVIGAGPTGLAAAKAASVTGQRVILCDEQNAPGGSLLSQPKTRIDGIQAADWIPTPNVTILTRATAFGWYPDQMIGIAERVTDHRADPSPDLPRERLWLVRAARVVIAAGAIERPMVFPNNDRPGIMLAGAAGTYLNRYGVLPGHRAVIVTSHDSAWHVAFDLAAAGVTIAAILDRRAIIDPTLLTAANTAGIPVHTGTTITNTHGRGRVTAVDIPTARIACDSVLMSDGWTPSVHLHSQARRPLHFDPATGVYLPNQPGSAGACAGEFDLAACLAAGHQAGGGAPKSFVVDATIARAFGVSPEFGISDYLAGKQDDFSALGWRVDGVNLGVFPTRPTNANTAELLSGLRFTQLMEAIRARSEPSIVICDLPPAFANDDAMIAAQQLDAYLMVVHSGKTTRRQLSETCSMLEPTPRLGMVLNRYEGGFSDPYGYNSYSKAYAKYY